MASQLLRPSGSTGQLAAGMPFVGVPLGPQMPPLVLKKSPPVAHGWAARRPEVLAQ